MSNTRHAAPGGPLRQERFASSYEQGLLANLVAKRCGVIESPEGRAVVWFYQWLSWQPGGLEMAGRACPAHIYRRTACSFRDAVEIFCLSPDCTDGSLWKHLVEFRQQWIRTQPGIVETSVSRAVESALDYTRSAGCLTLIDGPARTGKTFAARAWCERSAGLARYVQVPCSNDDRAFFAAIAEALGLSRSLSHKANEIRYRIEETLVGADLFLVLDEAHYLWPQHWQRFAMPARVNWVMTALVNRCVPVALVTTPQFYTAQKQVERLTAWTSEQFIGRIGHVERLPQRLDKADLLAVAKSLLPTCGTAAWGALAAYADLSKKHLASLEAIAKRASWLAGQDGRPEPCASDVRRAMKDSVIPSDDALTESLATAGKPARGSSAAPLRDPCRGFAAVTPARRFDPEIFTRKAADPSCHDVDAPCEVGR